MNKKVRYSFIVPIYNDGWLAADFCAEFERVMGLFLKKEADELAAEVELIFVNDGSRNDSWAKLAALPAAFPFVRTVDLSRNFGQHIALSCGYALARGQFVGMLNVDMEDPPSAIPLLLEKIEGGECDIVYGLRRERKGPWFERVTSQLFNLALNKLTGHDQPLNTATLRVMNRPFVDAYNSLTEKSRYIPGLEMWLGFRRGFVEIEHRQRERGRSSYNFGKRLAMATESVISFSDLPLRWAVRFGFVVAVAGFALGIYWLAQKWLLPEVEPGFTSTVSLVIFFSGLQIIIIGLAGLYIGRILKEVQNRPLYIVREKVNFD